MIGIIGAMDEEIILLKSKITSLKEKKYRTVSFYEGFIDEVPVVLMLSGIGKVNASYATTLLLEHYPIDFVINIGTAGGLKEDCQVLDIVLSEKVAHHDVDVTAFQYEHGQVPKLPLYFEPDSKLMELSEKILKENRLPYHKGLIVSGDQFINERQQRDEVLSHFHDVIAIEMEAAAIAQVCYLYNIPFIVLRSLSDIAGQTSNLSFNTYVEKSANQSALFVETLIKQL